MDTSTDTTMTLADATSTTLVADTAPKKGGGSSKKAFDFSRNSIWSVDPMIVAIAGGAANHADWHETERSDMDTDDTEDELYREDLMKPLDPAFVESVRKFWIQDPILIAKRDGVAVTIEGRTRIRAGRLVNAERIAAGLPALKIEAKQAHDHLVERMILANNARKIVDATQKIKDAQALLGQGYAESDVATLLGLTVARLRDLLTFDGATTDVKEIVESGDVSLTAGIEMAKVADPAKQREVVAAIKQRGGKPTVAAVRQATRQVAGQGSTAVLGKKPIKALLHTLTHEAGPFADGLRAALNLVLGNTPVDPRLVKFLAESQKGE